MHLRHPNLSPEPLLALAARLAASTTPEALAAVIGCSTRTVNRYQSGQTVRWFDADRLAINLGRHPLNIWPDFYEDAA